MERLAVLLVFLSYSCAQLNNTCPVVNDPNCRCDVSKTLILCEVRSADFADLLPNFNAVSNSSFALLRMIGYRDVPAIPDNLFNHGFSVVRLEILNCSFTQFEPNAFAGLFEQSVNELLLVSDFLHDLPNIRSLSGLTSLYVNLVSVERLQNLNQLPDNLTDIHIFAPNLRTTSNENFSNLWSLQQFQLSAPLIEDFNFTSLKSLVNLKSVRLSSSNISLLGLERIQRLIINADLCNVTLPDFDNLDLLEVTGDICLNGFTDAKGIFKLRFIPSIKDNVTVLDMHSLHIPQLELLTYANTHDSVVKILGNQQITSLSLNRIPICSNSLVSLPQLHSLSLGYVDWPFIPSEIKELQHLQSITSNPVVCNCSNFWVFTSLLTRLFDDSTLCLNSETTFVRYLRRTAIDRSCANYTGSIPIYQATKCGEEPITTTTTSFTESFSTKATSKSTSGSSSTNPITTAPITTEQPLTNLSTIVSTTFTTEMTESTPIPTTEASSSTYTTTTVITTTIPSTEFTTSIGSSIPTTQSSTRTTTQTSIYSASTGPTSTTTPTSTTDPITTALTTNEQSSSSPSTVVDTTTGIVMTTSTHIATSEVSSSTYPNVTTLTPEPSTTTMLSTMTTTSIESSIPTTHSSAKSTTESATSSATISFYSTQSNTIGPTSTAETTSILITTEPLESTTQVPTTNEVETTTFAKGRASYRSPSSFLFITCFVYASIYSMSF